MGLNNSQMLPDRVRKMRQMEDILQVEENALELLAERIDKLYQRASRLHEELINEKWLETELEERTGAETKVIGTAEELLTSFFLDVSDVLFVDLKSIRKFIEKWLPAHLRYQIILLQAYTSQINEKFIISRIVLSFPFIFHNGRYLDGSWLLDGTNKLNSLTVPMKIGINHGAYKVQIKESAGMKMTVGTMESVSERVTAPVLLFITSVETVEDTQDSICISSQVSLDGDEKIEAEVIIKKNLWYLNGSFLLNGEKKLSASIKKEVL